MYRGHHEVPRGFILGHEFSGTVTQVGDGIKLFNVGDKITCPFSIQWYATSITFSHFLPATWGKF